jgi:XTP/dITP diphosphohydrolase
VVIASKNRDKIAEIEGVVRSAAPETELVLGLVWEDVEETGDSLEENALLKARAVAYATGVPALADDTGLEVAALGGAPGVYTARFAGPSASYQDNVDHLLRQLVGISDRRATFRTVVGLAFPTGVEVTAEGRLHGDIATAPRGKNGFGYDPVFEVNGRTLGELEIEEKNGLSHRARAVRGLIDKFRVT